jgi:cellulose synthase/poly-beta-1,6-N-acetylglucosamine synthase-like glycosyltransferase
MTGLTEMHGVLFTIVALNALACMTLAGLQIFCALEPAESSNAKSQSSALDTDTDQRNPYFSVHVPTHNEPPEIVISTLHHLSQVDYEHFEVIVIDNNTVDPELWKPVEAACVGWGPRFRFCHRDNVVGAKAGALNIAAQLTSPAATHLVIVDADYQVEPDFLNSAAAAIKNTGADFVQFPQAYHDQARAPSVATELADYFLLVANKTNRQKAMLLTGTLSIINRKAFDAVGGWSGATITEDAELGIRLYLGNHRGVYIEKTVGRGMLPLDFAGLAKQRDRWVAGNVQTLMAAVSRGLLPVNRPALAIWSQLTAWISLSALPGFALVILAFLPRYQPLSDLTAALACATIFQSLSYNPLRSHVTDPRQPMTFLAWLRVRRVKLALLWTSSLAFLPALIGTKLTFQRTPKSHQAQPTFFMPALAMASALFAGIAIAHFVQGHILAGIGSSVLALCWCAARTVDAELKGSTSTIAKGLSA